MEDLYHLVLARNARETSPFLDIHEASATLLNQIDALQAKCEELERALFLQQEKLDTVAVSSDSSAPITHGQTVALRNETRLREKLEKLQEEMNEKMKAHAEDQSSALKVAKELTEAKDVNIDQEKTLSKVTVAKETLERAMDHLNTELVDAKSRTKLAEQQYVGLKDTIRVLQDENDLIKKENRELETRLVTEKEKMSSELNKLTEMVERLKKERDMLRGLKQNDEKQKSWFGLASISKTPKTGTQNDETDSRKWGSMSVVVPSSPKHIIPAHHSEVCCLRYDGSGADLVATGSADSTVKVWDTANGTLKATLRGGSSNAILSCDMNNGTVAGGGSDKTCRIWNVRTQRMVHHLVGHAHKVTAVRLFSNQHGVISASADRSMKVWDISRQTYRQTTTLRHSSTSNSIDAAADSVTLASGHLDGGVRFWDIRTGERTADIPGIHDGAITSVQFHPTDTSKLLTNGMDSRIRVVDIRTCSAVHTLSHEEFQTSFGWSTCSFSPDGKFIGSASNSNGMVFVWGAEKGELKTKLKGHEIGARGFAWGRGGTSGQQVASVDKNGALILWA